jgi:metal-dependent amidase/aminoacylase/carboxypeptidase family protein
VVSVCQVQAGETFNVLPDKVFLCGTTRFYRPERIDQARDWIQALAEGACAGTGCSAQVVFKQGYPPLLNAASAVEAVRNTVEGLFGEGHYREVELQGAGEDFARFLEIAPGALVWIGIRNEELGSTHFLHSPRFRLDEDCLWRGAALLASLARDRHPE